MSDCPPGNLVEPGELAQFNVPAAFLVQFTPRPLDVQISTGGVLGAMQFTWRWTGEANFSPTPIPSSATGPSSYPLDVAFAGLTFAARTYVLGETYTIDEAGAVTGAAGLAATRYDRRATACSAVTAEALTLMQDAVKRPLKTWTDDARTHAAAMVYAVLKTGVGSTAKNAGEGDENIYSAAALARAYFLRIGEKGRPDGWVDGSVSADGPMFSAYATSAEPARGW